MKIVELFLSVLSSLIVILMTILGTGCQTHWQYPARVPAVIADSQSFMCVNNWGNDYPCHFETKQFGQQLTITIVPALPGYFQEKTYDSGTGDWTVKNNSQRTIIEVVIGKNATTTLEEVIQLLEKESVVDRDFPLDKKEPF